ncbi:MAG: hypothetical protein NVS9B4_07200 [Candidatus Acidiferrum sp.]
MHPCSYRSYALCLMLPILAFSCRAQTLTPPTAGDEATVTIRASKPATYTIPRTIYGSFLEPISNSTYGGLWAEILSNPSFEEGLWDATKIKKMLEDEPELERSAQLALPLPWEPLDSAEGNRYEPRWNDAANSYRSLMVMGLPEKQVGVRQKVYLPVHRMLRYSGSIYVKHLSGPAAVEISLRKRNAPETIFAKSLISLSGNDWTRYAFSLELPAGKLAALEPADFAIAISGETRALFDQVSLVPDDNIDGMDPDMISMARAMRSPIIRFGGNYTSAYHWKDGIGPRDKRVSMMNVAWGIPEYNTFGTDEFLRFCQLVGAKPQIALNLGSGSAEEASAWARYVNERWGDHSGGLLWELGNELWGNFQVGYPTMERVAARTKAASEAVHKIDAHASLIATGGDEDSYHDWNQTQLANVGAFDYLSTHFVVSTTEVLKKRPSADFVAQASFALPVGLERQLRAMHEQIQSDPRTRDKVKIAFTEWLFVAQGNRAPKFDNMGGAINTAGFLNMLMRVADFVPISDMTGTVYFGGIWKERSQVFGVPAYWAFRMYSNANAKRPVETVTDAETYDVEEGSRRLPKIPNVPYLDIVAALDDAADTLTLFCVNRHLTKDIRAHIAIEGFTPAPVVSVQTLAAESIYEKNDAANPEAVHPAESSAKVDGGKLIFPFRHESVTVLTLRKSK